MEITNLDAPPIFDPLNIENCQSDETVLCLNFPFFCAFPIDRWTGFMI